MHSFDTVRVWISSQRLKAISSGCSHPGQVDKEKVVACSNVLPQRNVCVCVLGVVVVVVGGGGGWRGGRSQQESVSPALSRAGTF